jgi:hypothetical protein
MRRALISFALACGVLVLVIQLVPYGRNHMNPPVTQEPSWNTPETRSLAQRACFDCHSNETKWPWYTAVAPVSWITQHDVNEGRGSLNFSEWNRPQKEVQETVKVVYKREMPPRSYVAVHPRANLSASDRQTLMAGLQQTLGLLNHRSAAGTNHGAGAPEEE